MRLPGFILLFSLLSLTLAGQLGDPYSRSLGGEVKLEAGYNDFIFRDSRGFTWISSVEGLYRFDGVELIGYRPGQANSKGMLGKNIQSPFFEDSQGNIWFATVEGINCYRRKSAEFTHFQLVEETGDTISDNYSLVHLERDSILWLKARDYLYRYHIPSNKQQKIITTQGARFAVDTLADGGLRYIYACLWNYGSGFELITFPEKGPVIKKHLAQAGLKNGPKQVEVSGALVDEDHTAWLFSDQGLLKFEPDYPDSIRRYRIPLAGSEDVDCGAILDNEFLLVAAEDEGLWLFDKKAGGFSRYDGMEKKDLENTPVAHYSEIYIDSKQILWASCWQRAGVRHAWIHGNIFQNPLAHRSPGQPAVQSLLEDRRGNVWCATVIDGVFLFDSRANLLAHFPYDGRFSKVYQLSLSPAGEVWAMGERYMYRFNSVSGRWIEAFDGGNKKLFSLIHLSETAKLVSTNQGVWELFPKPGENKLVATRAVLQGDDFQIFQAFAGDGDRIYFPNKSRELLIYKKGSQAITAADKLPVHTEVYSVWEDSGSVTWLGTLDGLLRLNNRTMEYRPEFPQAHVLSRAKIIGVTGDQAGRLWLTTNRSLWRYDPQTRDLIQFRQEDGLPADEFSLFANLKTQHGTIWLGTDKGLVVFHPDSIRPYPFGPDIQIKELQISRSRFHSEHPIGETERLELNYNQNNLDFEVVAITAYLPQFATIRYRLLNYEGEWKMVGNGEKIAFPKVPPGKYQLQLVGINANGIEGPEKKIGIIISKPIWWTWWFWLLVSLAFGGLGLLAARYYTQRRLREQLEQFARERALQEALQQERNRIALEMHDDLGGGLTSIRFLLRKIKKQVTDENLTGNLTIVEKHATELIENMAEIIWAVNSRYDNLSDLVAYIRRNAVEFLDGNGIECKAEVPRELPHLIISGNKRRNIYLSVKEAVHNVVKHSGASAVELSIRLEEQLIIDVRDNGRGIGTDGETRFGNGLNSMQTRMEQVGGSFAIENWNGTWIRLQAPVRPETPPVDNP